MKSSRAVLSGVQSLSSGITPKPPTLMCVGTARAATIISGGLTAIPLKQQGKISARDTKGNAVCPTTIPLPRSRETAMTVSDKKYDCTTCPYPRYKDGHIIFCDVCIRKILDEQREKKQRKEQPNE